jgi:hypothetical protein
VHAARAYAYMYMCGHTYISVKRPDIHKVASGVSGKGCYRATAEHKCCRMLSSTGACAVVMLRVYKTLTLTGRSVVPPGAC